jgi:hypothetical protein
MNLRCNKNLDPQDVGQQPGPEKSRGNATLDEFKSGFQAVRDGATIAAY